MEVGRFCHGYTISGAICTVLISPCKSIGLILMLEIVILKHICGLDISLHLPACA